MTTDWMVVTAAKALKIVAMSVWTAGATLSGEEPEAPVAGPELFAPMAPEAHPPLVAEPPAAEEAPGSVLYGRRLAPPVGVDAMFSPDLLVPPKLRAPTP